MSRTWTLNSTAEMDEFKKYIAELRLAGIIPKVKFVQAQRSLPQNALIHSLYREIAEQSQDMSFLDITRDCKLRFGVGILKANDPEFAAMYDSSIKNNLTYERKLVLMDYMDITSNESFTVEMATEYIKTIIREYTQQGYFLANE